MTDNNVETKIIEGALNQLRAIGINIPNDLIINYHQANKTNPISFEEFLAHQMSAALEYLISQQDVLPDNRFDLYLQGKYHLLTKNEISQAIERKERMKRHGPEQSARSNQLFLLRTMMPPM